MWGIQTNKGFEWLLLLGNCAIYIHDGKEGSSMYKTCVHTPNVCETIIIISSHTPSLGKPYCFCHKSKESNKLVFFCLAFSSL